MLRTVLVRSRVCRAACGLQRRCASAAQLDLRVRSAGRAAQLAKQRLSAAVAAQKKQVVQAKQQQARQKASLAKQRAASKAQAARAKAQAAIARKKAAQARGAAIAAAKAWKSARAAVAAARKGVVSSKGASARRGALSKLRAAKKREASAARTLKKAKIAARRPKPKKAKVAKKTPKGKKVKKVNKPATGLKLKQRTAAARKVAKTTAAALVQAKKARAEGLKQLKARAKTPLCGAARKVSKKKERRQLRKQSGPTSAYTLYSKDALKGSKPGSGVVQAAAAKWKGMSDAEKQPYVREAAQNRAKYEQLKAAAKSRKPISKYQAFFKQHFTGAYEDAKRSGVDRKQAFKMATQAVSTKWKQQ
eukprot:TRINITY_DN400_c0_g1_i4.p1 TRINITY_DN400_c0_g1~~TRINITY_DN400_c0_g1_i4.p1  ORF type:complete len:384 (+),score=135.94 TRINITY_DN400_c0_g1_i4:65-1153(+)